MTAFNEGADAVYLGMKSFSARKDATNFSFEDLAKLRSVAKEQDKRIYVTVNTLVDDSQLDEAFRLLKQIDFLGCDGVILQDLGLVQVIKQHFPSLKLHGSTQLAVMTAEGVKELARLGFERVVLARELTFEEIKAIREACPDVQLKVFIHGSLCYGVSGLCMASQQLCGRSANCGSCAQICRNYFTVQKDEAVVPALSPLNGPSQGWFFSMSDLKAGTIAKELEELGIESLKVEGRMKSPAYTGLATRYYRSVLAGEEDPELDEALAIVFSRRQTAGWLGSYGRKTQNFDIRKAPTLGSTSYSGHRGIKAGTIRLVKEGRAIVELSHSLSLRDGLMYFIQSHYKPVDTVKFGVNQMRSQRGRYVTEAAKGELVELELPQGSPSPHSGEFLYLISLHDQTLPSLNEQFPSVKKALDLHITITASQLEIACALLSHTYPIETSRANKEQDLAQNLQKIFSQSDTSYYTLGELTIENKSMLADTELFLPLSVLKSIRRDWYTQLDRILAGYLTEKTELKSSVAKTGAIGQLPPRSKLVAASGLPYLDLVQLSKELEQGASLEQLLIKWEDEYYLPLSPVFFDEVQFFNQLEAIHEQAGKEGLWEKLHIGMNNLSQLSWARKHAKVHSFFDVYLYLSNAFAAENALQLLPSLEGGYLWMERGSTDTTNWPFEPTIVDTAFKPPLFISRSCFRHDSLMLSCDACPHRGSWYVEGSDKRYKVVVEDCITTVLQV